MTRILLTGKTGQVGGELERSLATFGELFAPNHREMDLSDPVAIHKTLHETRPEIILNTAAYTAVDKAEAEPEIAMVINGVAPGVIANEARKLGALVIHYSTDYVFDGSKALPYVESDKPNPLNTYGRAKLAGERAIISSGADYLILRTSWVYGVHGANFLLTMLRLAGEHPRIRVVSDQIGAPTWSRSIADGTLRVLEWLKNNGGIARNRELRGIYHLTCSGLTSWFGFATEIFKLAPARTPRTPQVVPISSADYPAAARRPKNSALSNEKIQRTFGISLEPWNIALLNALSELKAA